MVELIVWGIIVLGGDEVLLLRKINDLKPEKKEEWALVGGHVEAGESFRQALKREIMEEVGITVREEDMEFKYFIDRSLAGQHKAHLFFKITTWQGEVYNKESDIHLEARWHKLDNLPANLGPLATKAIRSLYDNEIYGEYGD